jgi:hypothetical protein
MKRPKPIDLHKIQTEAHNHFFELRAFAMLLRNERQDDLASPEEERDIRQGVGMIGLRLAADAQRISISLDEYLIQIAKESNK